LFGHLATLASENGVPPAVGGLGHDLQAVDGQGQAAPSQPLRP
jgi:hypothetical protein